MKESKSTIMLHKQSKWVWSSNWLYTNMVDENTCNVISSWCVFQYNQSFCIQPQLECLQLFLFFFFLVCRDRVSFYSPGYPGTHSVVQAGLKYTQIYLPLPPECWDLGYAPPLPGASNFLLWEFSYTQKKLRNYVIFTYILSNSAISLSYFIGITFNLWTIIQYTDVL